MASLTLILVHFLGLLLVVFCQKYDTGAFINPPEQSLAVETDSENNGVYALGSSMSISWNTNATITSLAIWQSTANTLAANVDTFQYLPDSKAITVKSLKWTIKLNGLNGDPLFDLTKGNIFHFSLYSQGATSQMAHTIWFNVTNSTVDARGSVISTPTPSPTSSIISTPTRSALSSDSPSPEGSSPAPGLSTASKIGFGVGVGFGVPILLLLIAGVYLLTKRKTDDQSNTTAHQQNVSGIDRFGDQYSYAKSLPPGQLPPGQLYELPHSELPPAELPSSEQPLGTYGRRNMGDGSQYQTT